MTSNNIDLLIIGAGPTGLSAAIEAIKHGLSFRIIDKKSQRSTFSKALVVHARTMEAFEDLGIAGAILNEGAKFRALNISHGPGITPLKVDLLDRKWGDTRYPFWLSIPQYDTEKILEERLQELGHSVEWNTEMIDLTDNGQEVSSTIALPDGTQSSILSTWILGCDGGRSRTREVANITMQREDCGATFVLCDAFTTSDLIEDEGHAFFSTEGLLLIVPMPEPHLFRLIAHVFNDPGKETIKDPAWWDELVKRRSGHDFGAHNLDWTSSFDLQQGVADKYRSGQVFLLGDAAHIHSPVGGQGLNTGVQDAYNLVWKLAEVKKKGSSPSLLNSYESERRPTAITMVEGTGKATQVLTTQNRLKRMVIGRGARIAMRLNPVRNRLGRNIGMLDLNYLQSPILGQKRNKKIQPGQRLPNPEIGNSLRLHDVLGDRGHCIILSKGQTKIEKLDSIILGDDKVPDNDNEVSRVLGLNSGDAIIVRPDRVIGAIINAKDNLNEAIARLEIR